MRSEGVILGAGSNPLAVPPHRCRFRTITRPDVFPPLSHPIPSPESLYMHFRNSRPGAVFEIGIAALSRSSRGFPVSLWQRGRCSNRVANRVLDFKFRLASRSLVLLSPRLAGEAIPSLNDLFDESVVEGSSRSAVESCWLNQPATRLIVVCARTTALTHVRHGIHAPLETVFRKVHLNERCSN